MKNAAKMAQERENWDTGSSLGFKPKGTRQKLGRVKNLETSSRNKLGEEYQCLGTAFQCLKQVLNTH